MVDTIHYMQKLMRDDIHMNKLNEIYEDMNKIPFFQTCFSGVDSELSKYIGADRPDYSSFYEYAYTHYIPKEDTDVVTSKYKELLGDTSSIHVPGYFYCLLLFAHYVEAQRSFMQEHKDDIDTVPEYVIDELEEEHQKIKLLFGFLDKVEELVKAFIDSVDNDEIEHLDDDIKELDATSVKHRFLKALQLRDKTMCFKLLGRMRELDEGEDYYFESLSHYINEEYDETIRYINKIDKSNVDYNSGIALKLECYSLKGDLVPFIQCITKNKELTFNYWHFEYLLISLLLRIDINDDANFLGDASKGLKGVSFDKSIDPYYIQELYKLIADIIVEGLNILEECEEVSDFVDDVNFPSLKMQRLTQLSLALSVFPNEIHKYLDFDYLAGKDIKVIKENAEHDLLKFLVDDNPSQSFECIQKAFLVQLKLGDTKGFLNNVRDNFDVLKAYQADELFRLAYIEGSVLGTLDTRIQEYVEAFSSIDLEEITNKKILSFLSEQGRIAYVAAEWQYQKSQEEDYGWKDAGMISLSFYRILEIELNKKVIIPLLSSIGFKKLNETYIDHLTRITGEEKKQYRTKWGIILKTYQTMEETNFTGNGFMLGVLYHFFKAIGTEYEESDAIASIIHEHLSNVLNTYGIEKLQEGFFESLTDDEIRNKYRNPPAHTRYLSYEVACECREVFQKNMLLLKDMLK